MLNKENQLEWENIYSCKEDSHKNEYPSEVVITWIKRNFGRLTPSEKAQTKCLDLGTGWGNNLRFLAKEGFDALGIDFSPSAIDHVKSLGLKGQVADFRKLELPDEHFDVIIDRGSIQQNPKEDIVVILEEVKRVLKPTGKFFSMMKSTGTNQFDYTTVLTEQEVRDCFSIFNNFDLDFYSLTAKNNTVKHGAYLLSASKA